MRCEICGRPIYGKPHLVVIEGAVLRVCASCAKLGKPYNPRTPVASPQPKGPVHRRRSVEDIEDLFVDPGYNLVVKGARERMGLTQEELAYKVGEKTSVISKIESGKLRPSIPLARKLEHALKIRIVKNVEELEEQ